MANPTANPPQHAVERAITGLEQALHDAADAPVWPLTTDQTAAALEELTRLEARLVALQLRVAAHAKQTGVDAAVGATSVPNWWAHTTRLTRTATHRRSRLADALAGDRHAPVRDALAQGTLLVEQARVIVDAVDALPQDLDAVWVEKAERHLVALAGDHDAKALRILGRHLLEVIAPDLADAHAARLLHAEEQAAAADTRLSMGDDGHGRTHGRFTLPTAQAEKLRKMLLAFAAPRHLAAVQGPGAVHLHGVRPGPERMGAALVELIERYPADRLPYAGGVSASIVVTIPLDTLTGGPEAGLAPGVLDTGAELSPGQVRKLACEAGIIPIVLDGDSQPLDVGREQRFHTKAQRLAIARRDQTCTAEGCDWPPGLCHVHHDTPWSHGGPTTLDNGRLLCPRHHDHAHNPHYQTLTHPNGKITFHRRT